MNTHPGHNSITSPSHPLKGDLSMQCKSLGEYNVDFGLLRPQQHSMSDNTNKLRSVALASFKG